MTDHRALKNLAENPEAVRGLARSLLKLGGDGETSAWTEWELDFLDHMSERNSEEPLSMRQREVLAELKNQAERHSEVDGLSVRGLIEQCWLERTYLDDEDAQAFVDGLKISGQRSVTRRQLNRLLRCCRELGVIESHHGFVR